MSAIYRLEKTDFVGWPRRCVVMVKRHKQEDMAGVLEFDGRTPEDPDVVAWMAEHKARKGGKIRVAHGGKGMRVMFSEEADMAAWKAWADQSGGTKKRPGL
jgi:hypothetical protein